MPHLLLLAAATTDTTTKAKSSSSSSLTFLILIVLLAGAYFLYIRPRSRRNRAANPRAGGATLDVGDEVISAGGILGVVRGVVGDEIEVEVAPGTTLVFWRRAVNLRSAVRGAPQSSTASDETVGGDNHFAADPTFGGDPHGSDDERGAADETGTVGDGPGDHADGPGHPDGAGGGA